jgi:hypothetical protein
MRVKTLVTCGLCIFGLIGCATPIKRATGDVRLGMSADQVIAILGDPARRSSRENDEAWRYEDKVRISRRCPFAGCRRFCEHITVWFNDKVVKSMTSLRVPGLAECGSGSDPVNWDLMPDYALLCYHDGLILPRFSESCFGSRAPAVRFGSKAASHFKSDSSI